MLPYLGPALIAAPRRQHYVLGRGFACNAVPSSRPLQPVATYIEGQYERGGCEEPFLIPLVSRPAPEILAPRQESECYGVAAARGGEARSDVLVTRSFTMLRAKLRRGQNGCSSSKFG